MIILNGYDKKNRNFQIFQNIKPISIENEFYQELTQINKIDNIADQSFNLIRFYNKINSDNIFNSNNNDIIAVKSNKNKQELTSIISIIK